MAEVLVVIGVGGMGEAIVERVGAGKIVVRADVSAETVAGHEHGQVVDVASADSVQALAETTAALGPVVGVAHTAGVSPVQAPSDLVIDVDLLGVAHVLEAFGPVMTDGGAGIVISSMSGHMIGPAPAEEVALLTSTPAAGLNDLACVQEARAGDPGLAYAWAKRATMHLVRAAARPWGERGARINSISPGVIATAMGNAELDGPHGDGMRQMVAGSGTGRLGTADDIAHAAAFLLSPEAGFVTGTDLLVDGGVVASLVA